LRIQCQKMSGKTTAKAARPLVLASTSRYRKALLARLGYPFDVVPADIDETPLDGERPDATARRLAEAKARTVAGRYANALVIGSDQVADADGTAISKPERHAAAVAQLRLLSGRTIVFHTAIALVDAASGRCAQRMVDVTSTFRVLSEATIDAYLRREQPYDCAGAVKSESLGIALFERIESDDPTALVGLPLIALAALLRDEGVDVLLPPAA
jgi:septum formation protein